jgi:hypothetical protein
LVKFTGATWVPAREDEFEMLKLDLKEKGAPNVRLEITMRADIRSSGLEQLDPKDMGEYIRFLIDSSQLGYDPLGWMKRREELGLRMDYRFAAAYRPPRAHKWRSVDCSGLEIGGRPKRK